MPNRILALDVQGHYLAAVMVESSFRGYRFVGHHFEPRDPSRPLTEQLRDFVNRHHLAADSVLSALSGDTAAFRILDLPFRDRRKLQQTVPFELESQVPFSLEDVIVDFQVISKKADGARVFAALVPRRHLEDHLNVLSQAGLDPAVVDFGPLTTLNVLQLFEGDRPGRYAFLHTNAHQGTLALYRNGALDALRVLNVSGEAEAQGFVRDVRWSLESFDGGPPEGEGGGGEPLPLLVGGPESSELSATLQRDLGLTVQCLEDLPLRQIPQELRAHQGAYAPALGLALREIADAPTLGLNFRRDEFAYQRGQREMRQTFAHLGALAIVVLVLFFTSEVVSALRLARDLEALHDRIRTVFTTTLPDVKSIVDESVQLNEEVEKLRKRQQQLGIPAGGPPLALEVLREVSVRAPTEPRMNVEELSFDADALRLRARTSSFEAVEAVKKSLAECPLFRDVQVKDPRTVPDGSVEFRLNILFGKGAGE